MLTKFSAQLFAVGYITTHGKTELLNLESGQWKTADSYPYGSYIFVAPVVYYQTSFIMFGGSSDNSNNIIAGFDEKSEKWTKLGELNKPRWGSAAVEVSNGFLITGGRGTYETEFCKYSDNQQITCSEQPPSMTDYAWYPEIFFVTEDFCK